MQKLKGVTDVDALDPAEAVRKSFSRQSLKRELASILDGLLYIATPVCLWLFAPLSPWFWVLVGTPAMMACLFLSSFIHAMLGVNRKDKR